MKSVLKGYKSSIILLLSIIVGGILGAVMGPKASILQPFGDLFLNLLFMIMVPMVFFSVTSAIGNMTELRRLGKIMRSIVIVFVSTALVSAVIGLIGTIIVNPLKGVDLAPIQSLMKDVSLDGSVNNNILTQIVNTFTTSDFFNLLSKKSMLPLIMFSILFGVATAMVGKKAEPVAKFLSAGSEVMMKMVKIIMYYAPVGLGCYFASVIGQLGTQILQGYFKVFMLYLVLTVIYYFGFFSLYAYIAKGKEGIKVFWKNAITPTVTALATCSSAACIPINLDATKNMGVPKDIAETTIPLGANIHKDGSVFGGVMKITFLFALFGRDITSISSVIGIIFVSFLVGAVMGAIPGGGMIGEMLILSVYGFPPEVLPIIAVISTIIDAPATLLNSTGNTVCAMMITRLVEGKKWAIEKVKSIA